MYARRLFLPTRSIKSLKAKQLNRCAAVATLAVGLSIHAGVSIAQNVQTPTTNPSDLAAANATLQQRVASLEAKVDQLENKEQTDHDDVQQQIKDVLADADNHSKIIPDGQLAVGYQPSVGFVISSADGNFSLHPGIVLDVRDDTTYRQRIPTGGGGETAKTGYDAQSGFDITRARLTLDGKFGPNVGYYLQFQDDQGTAFNLLDAFITYHFSDTPLTLKVGEFKDPLWHERNLSEARLLAVDRSLLEALIGGGQTSRVQGVSLMYDKDQLRGQLAIHDGFNSLNTKFYDAGGIGAGDGGGAGVTPTDFGVSGRAEYMLIGQRTHDFNPFTEYDQFTALGDKQDILVAGGGFDWSQGGSNDVLFHTLDLQYNLTSGWAFYGAYLGSYRDLRANHGVTPGNYYDPGVLLQAAYLVTPKIEPFVRYDYTYLQGGSVAATVARGVEEITVGANYYLYNQNAKFTVDGTWLPQGCPVDEDALGILQDSGQNELALRVQFQLAI
jgi:hypothetical protein